MNGNDKKWMEQFEKRIFERIDGLEKSTSEKITDVKEQLTIRHSFFLEQYDKSCEQINKNTIDIRKLQKFVTKVTAIATFIVTAGGLLIGFWNKIFKG